MKKILMLSLVLLALAVRAQTPCLFSLQSLTGHPNNRAIQVTPDSVGNPLWLGTNLVPIYSFTLQPVNGQVITNLAPWGYSILVDGWPRSVHIVVPDVDVVTNVIGMINTNAFSPLNLYNFDQDATNGLATTNYVNLATNGLLQAGPGGSLDGSLLVDLIGANISGPVPFAENANAAASAQSAVAAAVAGLATNVVANIGVTNGFITNSIFAGNGAGLTNADGSAFVSSNQINSFIYFHAFEGANDSGWNPQVSDNGISCHPLPNSTIHGLPTNVYLGIFTVWQMPSNVLMMAARCSTNNLNYGSDLTIAILTSTNGLDYYWQTNIFPAQGTLPTGNFTIVWPSQGQSLGNGNFGIMFAASTNSAAALTGFQLWYMTGNISNLVSSYSLPWNMSAQFVGVNATNCIDGFQLTIGGTNYLWYEQNTYAPGGTEQLYLLSSTTSPTNGYSLLTSNVLGGNLEGWQEFPVPGGYEGIADVVAPINNTIPSPGYAWTFSPNGYTNWGPLTSFSSAASTLRHGGVLPISMGTTLGQRLWNSGQSQGASTNYQNQPNNVTVINDGLVVGNRVTLDPAWWAATNPPAGDVLGFNGKIEMNGYGRIWAFDQSGYQQFDVGVNFGYAGPVPLQQVTNSLPSFYTMYDLANDCIRTMWLPPNAGSNPTWWQGSYETSNTFCLPGSLTATNGVAYPYSTAINTNAVYNYTGTLTNWEQQNYNGALVLVATNVANGGFIIKQLAP